MNPRRSRSPILGIALTAVLIGGVALAAAPLEAQRPPARRPAPVADAQPTPGIPCCEITAIDVRGGLVTARNAATGESFRFRVTDAGLVRGLTVGQKVYRAEGANQVGMTPGTPCCSIVAPSGAAAVKSPASSPLPPRRATPPVVKPGDLAAAFRSVLDQPAVREASRMQLLPQLRTNPPIALVDGYWVVPVDMGAVYGHPSVRDGLAARIPGIGTGARLDPILTSSSTIADRLGLVFVTDDIAAEVIGDAVQSLRGMIGVDAAYDQRTDAAAILVVTGTFALGVGSGLAANWLWHWMTDDGTRSDGDADADGIPNSSDPDADNDGTQNHEDPCPFSSTCGSDDEEEEIAPCEMGGCNSYLFAHQRTDEIKSLLGATASAVFGGGGAAPRFVALGSLSPVALGPAAGGRLPAASLVVAFPAGLR